MLVIDVVIVFVVVLEGVSNHVGAAERDDVVVLVEVLEDVDVLVGTALIISSCLPCSKYKLIE